MKFREAGGYNTHYIYMEPEDKRAISYDDLGLLHQPLKWLSSYPVHQAAVFEDIPKLGALLGRGGYEIDSLDASGETPLQRACMAGAALSVHYLINNGANPTLKSKLLGTVPLHWLFVFEPQEIHDVAVLLTSGGKSVLHEVANSKARAFHFPFRWPVGTPLEWAVFSNREVAVSVLLELGSGLEQINEFFPGPVENLRRETFRGCVYSTLVQYRLQVVRDHPAYKRKLKSKGNLWERDPSTTAVGNDPSATKQLDIATYIDYMLKGKTITRAAPLRDAIRQGNQGLVQLLLDSGARFDGLENPNEPAPLRLATQNAHLGIVKILLEKGADVNELSGMALSIATALYEAAKNGDVPIAKLLLEHGADPRIQCGDHGCSLGAAVQRNSHEVVELLLQGGADPNGPVHEFSIDASILQQATSWGNEKIVRMLLDRGADVDFQGGRYWTALQAAVSPDLHHQMIGAQGMRAIVELLLERGADVKLSGGRYGSVMQAAASTSDEILVKRLLDAGAPIDIIGGLYGSVLQAAVRTDNVKLVQLLLENGADPNVGDDKKLKSPLQAAVYYENEQNVKLLLGMGADPDIRGGIDGNALKTARRSGNRKIARTLLQWGAQDEEEQGQLTLIPNEFAKPPLSHADITSVRFLLGGCFSKGRLSTPISLVRDLVNKIIDSAEYWLTDSAKRHEEVQIPKNSPDAPPYHCIKIKSWPSSDMVVRRIFFRISQDTQVQPVVTSSRQEQKGPYEHGHTWFEVGVQSCPPGRTDTAQTVIQRNFSVSAGARTHNIIWDRDDADPQISSWIYSLKPGCVVEIFPQAADGFINAVYSVEIFVLYNPSPQ